MRKGPPLAWTCWGSREQAEEGPDVAEGQGEGLWAGTSRGGPESAAGSPQAQLHSRPLSPSLLPQSRDRKMVGDVTGAQSYASTAKKVNIVALVLGLILTIVLTVLLLAVVVPAINNAITQAGQNHGGY